MISYHYPKTLFLDTRSSLAYHCNKGWVTQGLYGKKDDKHGSPGLFVKHPWCISFPPQHKIIPSYTTCCMFIERLLWVIQAWQRW